MLGRRVEVGAGVPAPRQLLDRGDVDDPVVEEAVQQRHVPREEGAVGPDAVAGQRRARPLGALLAEVGQHLLLGLLQRHAALELVEEPGGGVHGADVVVHLGQRLGGRLDDHVDPLAEDLQVVVGDQHGDLDQGVGDQVEPGHLAVDPHQSVVHPADPTEAVGRRRPAD